MTQVIKINLLEIEDAAQAIQEACEVREAAGLGLRGCFENAGDLILVFQGSLGQTAVALG
ncbi:MAG: hypothetical protein ACOYB3_00030 [Azonexus sp.]